MAKRTTKKEETLNLDNTLFKCRDILRNAKNSGSFFEKRDIMLTLVFLRFLGEKYEDGVAVLRQKLIEDGLNPDEEAIQEAFLTTRPLSMALSIFLKRRGGPPLSIRRHLS